MKRSGSTDTSKLDRKTVEKNRRIHMKDLCFKLASLIPPQHLSSSKDTLSQLDQLEYATSYINTLRKKIEELKEKKEHAMKSTESDDGMHKMKNIGLRRPIVELRELGSSIEVILISGLKKNFMLYEVINILEEEGAEVVSASFYTVGDKIFHTLHAQVKYSRVGVETSRVYQRLHELIY